jgi:hypothetical protein
MEINIIRFIKLGTTKEKKEELCLENGYMILGYNEINHFDTIDNIKQECKIKYECDSGAATRHANQIKNFYDESSTTLWITFSKKKVWWGFVDLNKKPYQDEDGFTYRKMKDGWNDKDINNRVLTFENVSGALLKTQGFRGTICDIKKKSNETFDIEEYTKRLINGEKLEEVKKAIINKRAIESSMEDLVKMLHPQDFEYIVDLIFQYSGWKKLTQGAGVEKDLDLDLLMPLTEERAFVQIKSSTDQSEYMKYEDIFYSHNEYDRLFYVYHTCDKRIMPSKLEKKIHIMGIEEVAKLIVELGLITILMKKVS